MRVGRIAASRIYLADLPTSIHINRLPHVFSLHSSSVQRKPICLRLVNRGRTLISHNWKREFPRPTRASPVLTNVTRSSEIFHFEQLRRDRGVENTHYYVDCETAVYDASRAKRTGYRHNVPAGNAIPILFVPWEKPDPSDDFTICFGALALAQVTTKMPASGTLIYGDSWRVKMVNFESYVTRTRQIIARAMDPWCEQKTPPVVLNRHCAVCDFQRRCKTVATERDDLSLLTAMTVRERAKCAAKGIFTITQLSYGYRPRRRRRFPPDAKSSPQRSTPASQE